MTDNDIIAGLNAHAPGFIGMLGGRVVAIDREQQSCSFEFNVSTDFCHSVDVVQGGFVTAMLDAAMSHAVFVMETDGTLANVSSLEIKTSYLEPTRAGRLRAVGQILKRSYKTAFMEGRLYDDAGLLTATTSSVAKLVRRR
ncbi:MAG: PaaI family thioesterase [Halioglobus sp.]